jgi:hypothetical protein
MLKTPSPLRYSLPMMVALPTMVPLGDTLLPPLPYSGKAAIVPKAAPQLLPDQRQWDACCPALPFPVHQMLGCEACQPHSQPQPVHQKQELAPKNASALHYLFFPSPKTCNALEYDLEAASILTTAKPLVIALHHMLKSHQDKKQPSLLKLK